MGKRLSLDDYKEKYKDRLFNVLSEERRPVGKSKTLYRFLILECKECGNVWASRTGDLNKGCNCPECGKIKCHISKTFDIGVYRDRIKDKDFEIINTRRIKNNSGKDVRQFDLKCKICGHEWSGKYNDVTTIAGCSKCREKQENLDKIKNVKLALIDTDYEFVRLFKRDGHTRVVLKCDIDGYEWETSYTNSRILKTGCPKCAKCIQETLEELQEKCKNRDFYIISKREKIDARGIKIVYLRLKCKIDGYIWETTKASILTLNSGCPKCANRLVGKIKSMPKDGESLYDLRPDLLKYLRSPEDAKKYKLGSAKKIYTKCPDCGKIRMVSVSKLVDRAFRCTKCGDFVSIPEKFCMSILDALNIKYKKEKRFEWSGGSRYDFYLPEYNIIIETHGSQHYTEMFKGKKTYQKEIDNNKKILANKNGINNYIIVDCRKSELEHLKNSFINSLGVCIDLSNIKWENIYLNSQRNILSEVCAYWKDKKEHEVTNDVAEFFNIGRTTVIRYLKRGHKLGLCIYSSKYEVNKNLKKMSDKNKKPVNMYNSNGVLMKTFESLIDIERKLGYHSKSISKACKQDVKYKGYTWRFAYE